MSTTMLESDRQCESTTYDRAHFLAKFEAIPDERWSCGALHRAGRSCALGLCGAEYGQTAQGFGIVLTAEAAALVALLGSVTEVAAINDGLGEAARWGGTPRERVLAALRAGAA
jgi:hypothetical protein